MAVESSHRTVKVPEETRGSRVGQWWNSENGEPLGWWATPRRKAWRLTSLPRPLRRPGFQAELPEPSPGRAIQCQLTRCPRVPRPHTRRAGAGSPRGPPHGTPDDVSTAPRKYRRGGGMHDGGKPQEEARGRGARGGWSRRNRLDVTGSRAAGTCRGGGRQGAQKAKVKGRREPGGRARPAG